MAQRATSHASTDHDEIRRWAEERGAQAACVRGTGGEGDIGMLRLDFPGYGGEESLDHISWNDWFQKFDERNLALLFQEETAGGERSNFNKLVSRETADQARSARSRARSSGKRRPAGKRAGSTAGKSRAAAAAKRKAASSSTRQSSAASSRRRSSRSSAGSTTKSAGSKSTAKKAARPSRGKSAGRAKKGAAAASSSRRTTRSRRASSSSPGSRRRAA